MSNTPPATSPQQQYRQLLQHPLWLERRSEIIKAAGYRCQACTKAPSSLDVHHRYYVRGRAPWEYPNCALRCLCRDCHELAPATDGWNHWESVMTELEARGGDPITFLFLIDAAARLYAPLLHLGAGVQK